MKLFMSVLEIEMRWVLGVRKGCYGNRGSIISKYQDEEFMRRQSEMFGRDQDKLLMQIGTK
jgi:hypothetical protein